MTIQTNSVQELNLAMQVVNELHASLAMPNCPYRQEIDRCWNTDTPSHAAHAIELVGDRLAPATDQEAATFLIGYDACTMGFSPRFFAAMPIIFIYRQAFAIGYARAQLGFPPSLEGSSQGGAQ